MYSFIELSTAHITIVEILGSLNLWVYSYKFPLPYSKWLAANFAKTTIGTIIEVKLRKIAVLLYIKDSCLDIRVVVGKKYLKVSLGSKKTVKTMMTRGQRYLISNSKKP